MAMSKSDHLYQLYNVVETLSTTFTINWLFVIQSQALSHQQIMSIENIYRNALPIQGLKRIAFKALCRSKEKFDKAFSQVLKKSKMIKIVADVSNAHLILKGLQKQGRLKFVSQFYIYSPIKSHYQLLKLRESYPNKVIIKDSINSIIRTAEKEVNKWRLKFQILRNVIPLNDSFQQTAYQYRIKLHGCIKLNPEKFDHYYRQFQNYVYEEIYSKCLMDEEFSTFQISTSFLTELATAKDLLKKIECNSKQIKQLEMKIEDKAIKQAQTISYREAINQFKMQNAQSEKKFIKIMLSIYKENSIFHELLNQGLKKFSQKQFLWERISLPICLLFRCIKLASKSNEPNVGDKIKQKDQFILWRGGRISKTELSEIQKAEKQMNFYQFFSFVSTSLDLNVALRFINHVQLQKEIQNCLFKFVVKKSKNQQSKNTLSEQIFDHDVYFFPESLDLGQKQGLLKAMTIGKIIGFERLNKAQIQKRQQKTINKSIFIAQHTKILIITVEIGTFKQLFTNQEVKAESNQNKQQRARYKKVKENFMYAVNSINQHGEFCLADAYQLCNQPNKSYDYLLNEINRLIKENTSSTGYHQLQLLYAISNYSSKLSDICRKLGRLKEALAHNQIAIEKWKQIENIDKNRTFKLHQEKLNQMILKSSQILIESHRYLEASNIINRRIDELSNVSDEKQRQRNKVVIARLRLDLGVANFKQGNLENAQQIFSTSANSIQQIFNYINYDNLKQETFYIDWFKGILFGQNIDFFDGPSKFFEKKRQQNIRDKTAVYGGVNRLQHMKKNAQFLQQQTSFVITNHRKYFRDMQDYKQIIDNIQSKIQKKLQKQQASIHVMQEQIKKQKQPTKQEIQQIQKMMKSMKFERQLEKSKQDLNKHLMFDQKQDYNEMIGQQQEIGKQKANIDQLRLQFWEHPNVYFHNNYNFQIQFNQLLVQKRQLNCQNLLMTNNQITMEDLTNYFNKSANSIAKYIEQLKQLGYSESAPAVLKEYNRLIKHYINTNNLNVASEKIEEVKRLSNIDGQEKYFELAVAYFFKGKILQTQADIDFLVISSQLSQLKYGQIKKIRQQKAKSALQQFLNANGYFQKALIKEQDGKTNRNAFQSEPQQMQLNLWIVRGYLIQLQYSEIEEGKRQIISKIQQILAKAQKQLQKITYLNINQLKSQYQEVYALFNYHLGSLKLSLQSFQRCIKIRQEKCTKTAWKNALTSLKIVNLFYHKCQFREKLQIHIKKVQQSYKQCKNYSFFWKICLGNFYLMKECKMHKSLVAFQYIEDTLKSMEKQGFSEEHFYIQYEIIYDQEYRNFYNNRKAFLGSQILIKKKLRAKQINQHNQQLMQQSCISFHLPDQVEEENPQKQQTRNQVLLSEQKHNYLKINRHNVYRNFKRSSQFSKRKDRINPSIDISIMEIATFSTICKPPNKKKESTIKIKEYSSNKKIQITQVKVQQQDSSQIYKYLRNNSSNKYKSSTEFTRGSSIQYNNMAKNRVLFKVNQQKMSLSCQKFHKNQYDNQISPTAQKRRK